MRRMNRCALGCFRTLLGVLALGCGSSGSAGSSGNANESAAGRDTTNEAGGNAPIGSSAGGGAGNGVGGAGIGASSGRGGSAAVGGAGGMVTAKGCPSSQAPGTWQNVTAPTMNISDDFHGPITVGVDVVHPSDVYVHVMGDGTWKSIDCGLTWKKVSTGTNGDKQDTGRQWIATIDTNPDRDPATSPTLYVTQGYGANSVWKSTNGGVDWTNVWDDNIFAEDGVTNISKDVGNDISGVYLVDSSGPDHLILYLHSYYGSLGNNGIFESKDGGGKWVVHKAQTFDFQPHSDVLFPFDATTWLVTHGSAVYRTTDSAATWNVNQGMVSGALGRSNYIVGSTIYAGTDYGGGVYKSADKGQTFVDLKAPGNKISWVVATATKLYASNDRSEPHVYHAELASDEVWVDDGAPGMVHGGANTPGVLFDGEHYVLVVPAERGGVWRYVEP
jgi:hypothetical protein